MCRCEAILYVQKMKELERAAVQVQNRNGLASISACSAQIEFRPRGLMVQGRGTGNSMRAVFMRRGYGENLSGGTPYKIKKKGFYFVAREGAGLRGVGRL